MPHEYLSSATRAYLLEAIASYPGLLAPGITVFDEFIHLPIQPLFLEHIYGDRGLWEAVTKIGVDVATRNSIEVVVGAESAGIPLAASIAMLSGRCFSFVRKAGYLGHVRHEPKVRGHAVAGHRVMIVDDAIWTGSSLEQFSEALRSEQADVVCAFALIDMRELDASRWQETARRRIVPGNVESCGSYLELLEAALRRTSLPSAS